MNDKVVHQLVVQSQGGLHARPATGIAKLLSHYQSQVTFECRGRKANAKEVLSLLTLEATQYSELKMIASGIDAEKTIEALITFFNDPTLGELR